MRRVERFNILSRRYRCIMLLLSISMSSGCQDSKVSQSPVEAPSRAADRSNVSPPNGIDNQLTSAQLVVMGESDRSTSDASTAPSVQLDEQSETVIRVVTEELKRLEGRKGLISQSYYDSVENLTDLNSRRVLLTSRLNDQEAEYIAEHAKELRLLRLQATKITDNGLKRISNLPQLQVLLLGGTNVSQSALDEFHQQLPDCIVRKFPKHVYYDLCDTIYTGPSNSHEFEDGISINVLGPGPDDSNYPPLTDDIVRAIQDFREIQSFSAEPGVNGNIRELNFEDYQLTDETLRILSTLPRLLEIHISAARGITDEGLKAFQGHPTLRRLWFEQTSITDEGAAAFRKTMPHVVLEVDKEFRE